MAPLGDAWLLAGKKKRTCGIKDMMDGTFVRGCQNSMQDCMLLLGGYCLFRKAAHKTLEWGDTRERLSRPDYGQTQLGLDSVLVGCEHGILHKIGIPELPHAFP